MRTRRFRIRAINFALILLICMILFRHFVKRSLITQDNDEQSDNFEDPFKILDLPLAKQMRHISTPYKHSANFFQKSDDTWMGNFSCTPTLSCRFKNMFYFNNSFHIFLIGDSLNSSEISSRKFTVAIGLKNTGKLPIWTHKNLKPTNLLLRESYPAVRETSTVVNFSGCQNVSEFIDLLARLVYSMNTVAIDMKKSKVIARPGVSETFFSQILKKASLHEIMTIIPGLRKHRAILFKDVHLGIHSAMEIWDEQIMHLIINLLQRDNEIKKRTNICLFDTNEKLNFEKFAEALAFQNKSFSFNSGLNSNTETLINSVFNCDIVICRNLDCQNYIYLVGSGSIIIVLVEEKSQPVLFKPQLLDFMNVTQLIWTIAKNFQTNLSELMALSQFISQISSIDTTGNQKSSEKFIMYMPWEQLNNQLIGLKSTCAIASLLNRTLVLPKIGQRKSLPTNTTADPAWDFSFSIAEFSWTPIQKYFDLWSLEHQMPCKIITNENFVALMTRRSNKTQNIRYTGVEIDHAVFNPVAKATSIQQMQDYYEGVLGFSFASAINTSYPRMSQITEFEVLQRWSSSNSRVLAFGSAFWMFGFGRKQPYPLEKYENYMGNSIYRQTVEAMKVSFHLTAIVDAAVQSVQSLYSGRIFAVHVRRGDYWNKCKRIPDHQLRAKCYPTDQDVQARILEIIQSQKHGGKPIVYVATNIGGFRKEMESLTHKAHILYFEDVFSDIKKEFDSIDTALLDIEFSSKSYFFLGNFYSSFSRAIFERRELNNMPFSTF
ncbi:hypothetical protein HK100_007637 [Physocladia obscura]|uniref:GDP-fucose protein O-fucosyltransferase 2 n=1 Tax=Physocladia obscura TaxID=109957 RepID=A0AAD5SRH4_9FUNG|nr:hypothetical protein HK100_007637 [Physocladia obscura]